MTDGATPRPSARTILAWAAYLACSWTWCIGMFLPVLLVRDYGPWGFVVFAVPNVLGAAAMGWVLRSPDSSERIVRAHGAAIRAFVSVTGVFHLWFLAWLASADGWAAGTGFLVGLAILIAPTFRLGWGGPIAIRDAAPYMWIASSVAIGVAASMLPAPALWQSPAAPGPAVPFLAPVCAFGFALCPYLDPSFHRARRALADPRDSRAAFTLGFGVLFLVMILGTLLYSGLFGSADPMRLVSTGLPLAAVVAHVTLQSGYTWRSLGEAASWQIGPPLTGRAYGPLVSVLILAFALTSRLIGHLTFHGLTVGELGYRLFMAFYGLVFPAYVWLCMIPTRDGHSGIAGHRGRAKLAILAVVVALAAPAFWMGFIERDEWWLAPGLAVVLFARLLIPRGGVRRAPHEPSAEPAQAR